MSTNGRPEQLTLLRNSDLPAQLRLDQRTRERGLAHVAEIREQLAAMRARHAPVVLEPLRRAA